jgi:hypothetical protein
MRVKVVHPLYLVCFVLVMTIASPAQAAYPILIDDFSVPGLPEYTLSRVNDANGTSDLSFSDAGGDLRAAMTGTAVEQVLLLRHDYTLNVGETLLADVTGAVAGWDRDLGIAVGYSDFSTSQGPLLDPLAPGASGDARTSYVEVSVRSNNQIVSYARNGGKGALGTNLTSGQEFTGNVYGGVSFTMLPDQLYIKRLSPDLFPLDPNYPNIAVFEAGWISNGVQHALTAGGGIIMPYNVNNQNAPLPGPAVGFYADMRAVLTQSPDGLDNLRIVPEPATSIMALIGIFGLGLIWLRKRS